MSNNNTNVNELTYVSQRLNSIDLDLECLVRKLDTSEAAILDDILSSIKQSNNRIKCLIHSLDKANVPTNTTDIDLPSTQGAWID
jgi:enoyl-[acyl-carrier-protein] reductase (NADH)